MQKSKVWVMLVRALCLACMPLVVWASPTVIQVVHDGNANGFATKVVKEWSTLLKERSKGNVVLRYDARAKHDIAQAIEDMADGKNVIALVALPVQESTIPNAGALSTLPEHTMEPLLAAYGQALRHQGFRVVMDNYHGGTSLFLAKKPLYKLSDLAGLRIATTASPVQQQLLEAQGATPVVLDPKEVASALTYGSVDGAEGSLFTLYEYGWLESARYLSAMGGEPTVSVWLGSETFLDGLPSATQELIAETAKEAGLYSQELAATYTEEITQELQAEGVQLIGFDSLRTVLPTELEGGLNQDLYRVPTATTMTP
ncbi:MAG: TRAP transporter substrate-binding protein [Paenalcaligenes sp.]